MSRLASELQRLRRSPWEVLWSALVSCGLVLFSQLAVAIVPRLLPSISLLAMLPVAGLVFLATIVVGRFWRRFIGVAASAPLFVLFNVLFLWGVYVFVIRRDTSSLLDMLINAECALLLWGLYRILSGDPGIVAYETSFLEEAGCKDFVDAICSSAMAGRVPDMACVRHLLQHQDRRINWKKYPEFQMKEQPQSDFEVKFVNPYDKGMLCNIREFLKPK